MDVYVQSNERRIVFLLPIAKLSNICGLIPMYDIHTRKLIYRRLFKWYSLLLSCVMSYLSLNCCHDRFVYVHHGTATFSSVVDSLSEIVGLLDFLVTTFGAAFLNMDDWQNLITHLRDLASRANTKLKPQPFWTNTYFISFIGHICYFIIFAHQVSVLHQVNLFISTSLTFYCDFIVTIMAINIVVYIIIKLEEVNKLLVEFNFCKNGLGHVTELYLSIGKIVECFNVILGWPIFGIIAHFCCHFLNCLGALMVASTFGIAASMVIFLYGMIVGFGPVLLLFCCDMALAEAKMALKNCQRLQQYLPINSNEAKDLNRLAKLLRNKPPVFTAAGFYELNRSTFLYLLSTITTYFIVAIQFKKNKK